MDVRNDQKRGPRVHTNRKPGNSTRNTRHIYRERTKSILYRLTRNPARVAGLFFCPLDHCARRAFARLYGAARIRWTLYTRNAANVAFWAVSAVLDHARRAGTSVAHGAKQREHRHADFEGLFSDFSACRYNYLTGAKTRQNSPVSGGAGPIADSAPGGL